VNALNELILELSYNCDLACTMCGFGGKDVQPGRFMSEETVSRVLDAVDPPPRVIRLNGRGESTIHPKFVEILRQVRSRNPDVQINLFSHLSWSRPGVMAALIECGVQLFISMDSHDPERLAAIRKRSKYEKIVANIDRLASHAPRPFLIFTLQEENFDDVVSMARFALEREVHLLVNTVRRDEGIERFRDLVRARADDLRSAFREVSDLYRGRAVACFLPDRVQGIAIASEGARATYGGRQRCPAIDRELCVLFDGTVTPCNMFNPYAYGNILKSSLAEIRGGERFQWFSDNHKQHPYCANCACLGGTA
jgi:MoaA/NifB/PqqE/SkfB family radical SAM enzyme